MKNKVSTCVRATIKCRGVITAKGLCTYCYRKEYREKNLAKILLQESALRIKNRSSNLINMKRYKQSPKGRYKYMELDSKARGLSCTLTLAEYADLISRPCHYCKEVLPPSVCTGLDRKDNARGYEPGNVLPCCGDCNVLRGDKFSVEEFEVAMNAILEFRVRGKVA